MDCEEVRESFDDWLDGELDDASRKPFQKHLESCPTCAQQAESGVRLKHLVRVKTRRETLPAGLEGRVREAMAADTLAGVRASRVARRIWASLAALALAALIPVGVLIAIQKPPLVHADVAEESLSCHLRFLHRKSPQVVCDSVPEARRLLKQMLGKEVHLPEFDAERIRLLGLCRKVFGAYAGAHLHYQMGERELSLFVIPSPNLVQDRDGPEFVLPEGIICCCKNEGDLSVHCCQIKGTYICLVVGESQQGEFQKNTLSQALAEAWDRK